MKSSLDFLSTIHTIMWAVMTNYNSLAYPYVSGYSRAYRLFNTGIAIYKIIVNLECS